MLVKLLSNITLATDFILDLILLRIFLTNFSLKINCRLNGTQF